MKQYKFAVIFLLILIPIIALPQSLISFKIGFVQSKIRGAQVTKYPDNYEWKGGFSLATSAQFIITRFLVFEPEFMYAENGFDLRKNQYDRNDSLISSTIDHYNYNYFKLSLITKLYSNHFFNILNKDFSVFLLFGPQISALIHSSAKKEKAERSYNLRDSEVYDLGLTFGTGAQYSSAIGVLSFAIRYSFGFVNMQHFYGYNPQNISLDVFNKSWILLFGYSIKINN